MININSSSKIIFYGTFLIFGLFFLISFSSIFPNNPINIPEQVVHKTNVIFPQGWGFFSKNPRDEYFYIVDIENGEIDAEWPNMTYKNIFGINRYGRGQGIELGRIFSDIGESNMMKCDKEPLHCLRKIEEPISIHNDTPNPTLLGDKGIVLQEPVPWSWANKVEKNEMPSSVVRVKIYD